MAAGGWVGVGEPAAQAQALSATPRTTRQTAFEGRAGSLITQPIAPVLSPDRRLHADSTRGVSAGFGQTGWAAWGEIFGDPVAAAATIDRLVHHAEILSLQGDSYGLRDRKLTVHGPRSSAQAPPG